MTAEAEERKKGISRSHTREAKVTHWMAGWLAAPPLAMKMIRAASTS